MKLSRWAFACAGALVLAAGDPAAASAEVPTPNVIPVPAEVEPGRGALTLTARTRVYVPEDPAAAASARYFIELLRVSHADWLRPSEEARGRIAQRSIRFTLERTVPTALPEPYRLAISSRHVLASSSAPRGPLH